MTLLRPKLIRTTREVHVRSARIQPRPTGGFSLYFPDLHSKHIFPTLADASQVARDTVGGTLLVSEVVPKVNPLTHEPEKVLRGKHLPAWPSGHEEEE